MADNENGRIDEDVYSLQQMKQLASSIYNQRINRQGGVHEDDKFADDMGGVLKHLDEAIIHRSAERKPEPVAMDDYWGP